MRLVILIFVCFTSNQLLAFNWDNCVRAKRNMVPPLDLFLSSSGYLSSTGDCAMIGIANHDRKVFLAHNLDQIQNDSARGGGEYLQAYSQLSGCNLDASRKLSIILKENFIKIYGVDGSKQPQEIYESMEEIMKSDPNISSGCSRGV